MRTAGYGAVGPGRAGRRIRGTLIVVAICLAFGVSWAGFVWAGGRNSGGLGAAPSPAPSASHSASSPRSPSPAPTSPSPALSPSVIGLGGLRWVNFHGAELPVSPVAGPRVSQDGVVWGFADSRLGALLAAVNIAVRANAQWGSKVFGPTIRAQVVGPDSRSLLRRSLAFYERARRAAGLPDGVPLGPLVMVVRAFRWLSYRPSAAVVDVVSAAPSSTGSVALAVTWVAVRWLHGDWRVVAPPGGDWGNAAAPLASLRGYIAFPSHPA